MNNNSILESEYQAILEDTIVETIAHTSGGNFKLSIRPMHSLDDNIIVIKNPECALDDKSLQELRDETKKLFLENLDKLDTEVLKKINNILKGVI